MAKSKKEKQERALATLRESLEDVAKSRQKLANRLTTSEQVAKRNNISSVIAMLEYNDAKDFVRSYNERVKRLDKEEHRIRNEIAILENRLLGIDKKYTPTIRSMQPTYSNEQFLSDNEAFNGDL